MRALRTGVQLLGLAVFAWLAVAAGPADVLRELGRLDLRALALLIPYTVVFLLDTLGWWFAFPRGHARRIGFPALVRIRAAAESVNMLVPSATLAGEPVKVWLAAARGVPALEGAQSVVVAKTTITLAQLLFVIVTALACARTVGADSALRRGFFIVTVVSSSIVALLFWLQARGLFTTLLAAARALGIRMSSLSAREPVLADIDARITAFYREHPWRVLASTAFYLAGWLAGVAEVWLAVRLLGADVAGAADTNWLRALAIEAAAGVAKAVGTFAPGSLGVQDSSIAFAFRVCGLPVTLGISYAILRRVRELVWVALGLVLLAREQDGWKWIRSWKDAGTSSPRPG
jgi:uncharacterized membrane protein YbhN (UPF0104 family)